MEFKAERVNGEIIIKPIIEKKINAEGGTDITVHLPSFPIIQELKENLEDGKRNIQ